MQRNEAESFKSALRKILATPKDELERREAKEKASKKEKNRDLESGLRDQPADQG